MKAFFLGLHRHGYLGDLNGVGAPCKTLKGVYAESSKVFFLSLALFLLHRNKVCSSLVAEVEEREEEKKFEGRKQLWQWFPESCQEVCEVQIRPNLNLNIDVDAEGVCLHKCCDGRANCSL